MKPHTRLNGRSWGLLRVDPKVERQGQGLSSVSLAGLAAHLPEIGPAAELEPEHQGAVSHSVHIFTLCRRKEKTCMCHSDDMCSHGARVQKHFHLCLLLSIRALTFGVVCVNRKTEVTFAFALLHGCWALMVQTLVGQLASVCQTLH